MNQMNATTATTGKWHEFDELDAMGFAGAEDFAYGVGKPLTADIQVDDLDAVAILDRNGLYIQVMTPEGEEVATFTAEGMIAARFAALLKSTYETGELVDAGLTEERQS